MSTTSHTLTRASIPLLCCTVLIGCGLPTPATMATGAGPGTQNTAPLPSRPMTGAPDSPATSTVLAAKNPSAAIRGKSWLSGVATRENGRGANPAKYFGDWRGARVEIGQTWPDTPDVWGINPAVRNSWAGFRGPMSLSFTPGRDWRGRRGWRSYAAIARGDMDAWWRAAAKNTRKLRAGKGTTFVSPFYEYNGDWMKWSVKRTKRGYADFRKAWARVAKIWRKEFPQVKLVLPATCARNVPAAMMPAKNTYDLVGCTVYNAWPWSATGKSALRQIETGRKRAKAVGKPFAITEWANSANRRAAGGGGEAPGFMSAMHSWMRKHAGTGAGQLVFETFFNIDGYDLDHIMLRFKGSRGRVSGAQDRTAARYRALWRK